MAEPDDSPSEEAPATGPLKRLKAQFRKRPVVAWGGTAVLVGLIAGGIVILVVGESEPKNTPISCTVHEYSSTLRLTFDGKVTEKEAEEGCGTSTEGLSSAASYWVVGTPPLPEEEPQLICALSSPDEPMTVLVEEVPDFASKGESYCGALAGEGWTQAVNAPLVGPGQLEYQEALAAEEAEQEEIEEEELEIREDEEREQRKRDRALARCEATAESTESEELEQIEEETEERAAEASDEFEEYEIEEEGYEAEEEAYEREFEAVEACEREAEVLIGE